MSSWLRGIGTAVPEHHIGQAAAAKLVSPFNADSEEQCRVLRELYRRTGVRRRHSVVLDSSDAPSDANGRADSSDRPEFSPASLSSDQPRQSLYQQPNEQQPVGPTTAERMRRYEDHAGTLAAAASRRAFATAGIESADVTHLVTVSCSGFHAPGFDIELLQTVGLSPAVARTHVGFMGCHGALNGLRVADAFLRSDSAACVLLCCVELCSVHHQYGWAPHRIVSNALFADGAAAVVLTANQPDDRSSFSVRRSPFPGSCWRLLASGSVVLPETRADMGWRIRDHGFEMTLSARVPDLIRQHLRGWLSEWLTSRSLRLEEIGSWAIHPGGPRILSAAGEALGLRREQWSTSEAVLGEYGNMSSPTILFILDRLSREASASPCVALAFGPGLTIEAALLELSFE